MITFNELALSEEILKAVGELGFETPTPVQEKSIPHLLTSSRDLLALAQTGTGKTAAFGLPTIEQIQTEYNAVQAFVLCPTRELCIQITKDLQSYAKYKEGVKITAVYGGASIDTQIRALRRGVQIVVGTPGRVLDMMRRKALKIDHIQRLILDEADEMLSMGFKEELTGILAETPDDKQTLLFSATMPREIKNIADKYMKNPLEVTVGKKNAGAENVDHIYYMVQAKDRYEALKRIADINPNIYGIVFCRTRRETMEVAAKLIRDGYNADALHGELSQAQRDQVMGRFRQKHLQILVATDVAARGLDVTDLTHIINYNLPDEPGTYVHRSGRTGRAGKKGLCVTIIHGRERNKIYQLEQKVDKKFKRENVPNGQQVCEKRLYNVIDKIQNVEIDDEQIAQFMPVVEEKLSELTREDMLKRLVSVEFSRFLRYYKNARDLNIIAHEKPNRSDRREGMSGNKRDGSGYGSKHYSDTPFTRFHINLGRNNNMTPQRLMGVINENIRSKKVEIGKIEIMKKFSFFEIDSRYADKVTSGFQKATFDGEQIFVETVNHGPHDSKGSRESGESRDKFYRERSSGSRGRSRGGDRDRRPGIKKEKKYFPKNKKSRGK
jgi:ATP-dependent RNA helicase DeaD